MSRPAENENTPEHRPTGLSRRGFISVAAAAAGARFCAPAIGAPPRLHIKPGTPASRAVQIYNAHAVNGPTVHPELPLEMIERAVMELTTTATPRDAWHSLLEPDDIVGIKFNRSGRRIISTTESVATNLVQSLADAGWDPERIVLIEVDPELQRKLKTRQPFHGYEHKPVDFQSGTDQFASVLNQVTALINVPFLKTHNICKLSGALKNLSHGLIRHPARFHGNGCSPYIADIVAAPPIRTKLQLNLVDALRVVFRGGPTARVENLHGAGMILASRDPVAVDTLGLAMLNDIRLQNGLPPLARSTEEIGYLVAAHERNLGIALWHGIDLVRVKGQDRL